MKKLALALVCFASVAFFASCQQEVTNPEPTISVITDDGFVKNGDVIDVDQEIVYGFQMASNSQTKKELKQLSIITTFIDIEGNEGAPVEEIISLAGKTEYRFVDTVGFVISDETRDIIGSIKTVATVTDVDGKINTATLNLSLNKPAEPLEEADFTWFRHGSNDGEGLEEYGLEWTGNGKEVFAIIKPVAGATLYSFTADTWNEVNTDVEKAAVFSEALAMSDFRGVSAWYTKTYDYVIGTLYNGEYHLIHITNGVVDSSTAGTDITITGQAK